MQQKLADTKWMDTTFALTVESTMAMSLVKDLN